MNLGEFRAIVKLQLGNMPDDHPLMAYLDQWINSAIRDFPQREIPGDFDRRTLFQELTRETLLQPAPNQSWVLAPQNMLAPLKMFCYYDEEQPNLNTAQAHPVTKINPDDYRVLHKDSTTGNWTQLYAWFDARLYLWPTPVAGRLGWLHFSYLFEQPDMTAPEHVPVLDQRWHRAAAFLATAYGEAAQNHVKRAEYFEAEANKALANALNWYGRFEQQSPEAVMIAGDLTSSEVYD